METEGQAPQRIADGCALHSGEPFTAICRQCGTYMCKRCSEDGRFDRCERCRNDAAAAPRAAPPPTPGAFPFRRDGLEWGRFLRFCFDVYTQNFGLLTLMVLCVGGIVVAGSISLVVVGIDAGGPTWFALQFAQLVLLIFLMIGGMDIVLRLARRQPASLRLLFGGSRQLGRVILVVLVFWSLMLLVEMIASASFVLGAPLIGDLSQVTVGQVVVAGFGLLLGFSLIVYVSLGWVFASIEAVAQPQTSMVTVLKNAWRLARGQRLTIAFGLFLINTLLLGGVMMCGVGVIFTLGYASVLFAALYLALRNGDF